MISAPSSVLHRLRIDVTAPIALGLVAGLLHRAPAELTPPAACPGLAEWAAVLFARLNPQSALGLFLVHADRAIFAAATALIVGLMLLQGTRLLGVLATWSALLVLPLLAPRLAPFWSAGLLVSAAIFLALTRRRLIVAAILLAFGAALSPPNAPIYGAIAAAGAQLSFRASPLWWRATVASIAALVVVLFATATNSMIPTLVGEGRPLAVCVLVPPTRLGSTIASIAVSVVLSAGPYALSLATLGTYGWRRRLKGIEAWLLVAFALSPLAVFFVADAPARSAAPLIVGFWILVANGVNELVAACRSRRGGLVPALIFVALTPLLVIASRADREPPARVGAGSFGHELLSRGDIERIRSSVPETSAYVVEEAVFDVLLRASARAWAPTVPVPEVVAVDTVAIGARIGRERGPVFAMPLAQARLQNLGFRLSGLTSVPGVAAIQSVAPCGVLNTSWRDLAFLKGATALSIAAQIEEDAGPVVIYAQTVGDPIAEALRWPPRAMRGMGATVYLAKPEDRERLERDAAADGLNRTWLPLGDSPVLRLELWRIPEAPMILPVSVNSTIEKAAGHLVPDGNLGKLTICPAFPHEVTPFEVTRR